MLSVRFFLRTQSVVLAHDAGLFLFRVLQTRGVILEDAKRKSVRSFPYRKLSELMETFMSVDVRAPLEAAELAKTHLADGWLASRERDWLWSESIGGPAKMPNLSWAHVELIDPALSVSEASRSVLH